MTDPITRAMQFIELAVGSTNEHEARNAAMHACKIIKSNGIRLVQPQGFAPPRVGVSQPDFGARVRYTGPGPDPRYANVSSFHEILEELFKGMGGLTPEEVQRRSAEERVRNAAAARGAPEPPMRKRSEANRPARHACGATMVKTRASGQCKDCGSRIDADEPVWWMDGKGIVHRECDPTVLR